MSGQVIKGLDEAIRDMQVGESAKVHLEPDEAYGAYDPEAVRHIPIDQIPLGSSLPVGQHVMISVDGQRRPAKVATIVDGVATFDLNHPLAGKALDYEVTLVSVE
jgi:FKBP-type peptidyl-prolyl cis-trans isomerase 2